MGLLQGGNSQQDSPLVPRLSTSYRGATQTGRPSFLMGLNKEHEAVEGKRMQESWGHPRKPFWLSKRNSSKKAGTKCAKYRSQWNSLIKLDFKSSIQKLERKCIRGDKKEVWHRHIWPASNPVAGGQVEGLKRAAVESGEGEAYSLELMV